MNDKTKKILMGLGVVFTAALMLTLYFFDWAMIGTEKKVDEGQDVHDKFQKHIVAMNINFDTKEEYHKRLQIFASTDAQIEAHNNKGTSKFKMGHNHFSTMTKDEKKKWRGNRSYWAKHQAMKADPPVLDTSSLPASVDWRDKGAVNPVKNQQQCGSCYTFGSTAVVEASVFINGNDLPNLSEQQIVSCS
jgi:cathepsin L